MSHWDRKYTCTHAHYSTSVLLVSRFASKPQDFFEIMAASKENDEATKLQKRCNAIEAIKAKPEYSATSSLPTQPAEPDPYEKMSKRRWEKSVMTWRAELRARLNELSL